MTTMKLSRNAKIIAASVGGLLLLCAIVGSQSQSGGGSGGASGGGRLAQLQQAHAELMQRANECAGLIDQSMAATQQSVMNGGGVMPPPPCEADMQVWTAQAAMLEKEIHELSTGDHSTQVIDYVPRSGDTSGSVNRWTRGAIRGTTNYRDDNGEIRELPTAAYYYRDRASGQIYASDLSQPPADGHDYEQLQPAE
jgi:hypothetical protein